MPANSFGGPNPTSIDGCKPESSDDVYRAWIAGVIAPGCSHHRLRGVETIEKLHERSKSADEPALSPRLWILIEIFDFLTDGVACANAINSTEPFFAPFRYYYLVFLVTSSIACIVSTYIRVHAMRFSGDITTTLPSIVRASG